MDAFVSKKLFASNAVTCQMKEYNNSGLVVILHCRTVFDTISTWHFYYYMFCLEKTTRLISHVFPHFIMAAIPHVKYDGSSRREKRNFHIKYLQCRNFIPSSVFSIGQTLKVALRSKPQWKKKHQAFIFIICLLFIWRTKMTLCNTFRL